MKSLHGVLHGGLWIRVHGLSEFVSSPPPRGGSDENSGRPWFFQYFFQHDKFRDKLQGISITHFMIDFRTNSKIDKHHQIILLNWWNLRHIILNQILSFFSASKVYNGPTTWSILTSHYARGPETTYNGFPNTHGTAFGWEGSSPLQGHGSWLMCEVALIFTNSYVS